MYCYYISHQTAPVGVRKKYIFTASVREELLSALGVGVILCTCNRTEFYVTKENTLSELKRRFSDGFTLLDGERAERRLFALACGLDSMLIGEDEILGQLKEAYLFSLERGYCDTELNLVMQAAIACGKRSKALTEIADTPRSVATLAVNEAVRFGKGLSGVQRKAVGSCGVVCREEVGGGYKAVGEDRDVADQPNAFEKSGENCPIAVLLVGSTGKMGRIVLANLSKKKGVRTVATRRSCGLLQAAEKRNVGYVDYGERYRFLSEADVVICCTASPHTVFEKDRLPEGFPQKRTLFLDLSIPPDVDEAIGEIEGVTLIGLDDFKRLAEAQNERYRREIARVERVCGEEFALFCKRKYLRSVLVGLSEAQKRACYKVSVREGSVQDYIEKIGRMIGK